MFKNQQFRECLIRPTLKMLSATSWSPESEELLIATMAHESNGGKFLFQTAGPALGLYQMEPATHDDLWNNYLQNNSSLYVNISHYIEFNSLLSRLPGGANITKKSDLLPYDHVYATIMARLQYMRHSEALPPANDIHAIYAYYKKYYNSDKGAATESVFIENYKLFIK